MRIRLRPKESDYNFKKACERWPAGNVDYHHGGKEQWADTNSVSVNTEKILLQ